ncbi:MAG: sigma-70 family RNA polymerase sigma factor [Myxococcales bacterium]|nr:sigma-70 family RNA polymerase sigma factor [Myxococcales bacterium]MCB9691713.1 sigma-70 family RNA polymerase sigma factor [Alphaproteobacteria bacterium]
MPGSDGSDEVEEVEDGVQESEEDFEDGELDDAPVRKVPKNLPALGAPPAAVRRGSKKDLLSYYLAEVRKHPLLTREEEHEYAVRFVEDGDAEAAERLVTANLRLVIKIAFQYHRQWANVLDLIQEGNVGLVEALSRYDPYRDIRFSSYAQYWIRAMILRFLLDNFRLVRLGSTRAGRKLFFQLQKERDRLLEEGKAATPEALAERLGVKPDDVTDVDQHMRAPALSLHAPAGEDGEGRSLSEIVPEKVPNDPEVNAARSELGSLVQEKLAAFAETLKDERERMIWERRLVATDPDSLSALGDEFQVSKERVRQLEARIKKRLKAYLEAELGDAIDFEFSV